MAGEFKNRTGSTSVAGLDQIKGYIDVTPADDADLSRDIKAVNCSEAGIVRVTLSGEDPTTTTWDVYCTEGHTILGIVQRIHETGTTATISQGIY